MMWMFIALPLMALAIAAATLPVVLVSLREERLVRAADSRPNVRAPIRGTADPVALAHVAGATGVAPEAQPIAA